MTAIDPNREEHSLSTTGLLPAELQELHRLLRSFQGMTYDELRSSAPGLLTRLLPGATLSFVPGPEAGTLEDPPFGAVRYTEFHRAPPEPFWLRAEADGNTPQAGFILETFCRELGAALTAAGYMEELDRQARVDWLTGLPGPISLERKLLQGLPSEYVLGLVALPAPAGGEAGRQAAALRLRGLAHALRLLLTEQEEAFSAGAQRLAVLASAGQQQRLTSFFGREAPDCTMVWLPVCEAPGLELLQLAEARLRRPEARPDPTPAAPPDAGQPEPVNVQVRAGSPLLAALTERGISDWAFPVPITLIIDEPPGFALQSLGADDTAGSHQVVITSCNSHGYLLDVQAHQPAGLLLQPLSLADLRTRLGQIADGERLYSGPLLNETALLERERLVWRLVARGHDNERIAEELDVKPKTAANYVSELLEKLGLSDRAALALKYWQTT